MPLPTDEKLLALSQKILEQFDAIFGYHPGFRPAHAKGTLLSGTFTPSNEAVSLTIAPHIQRPSTPVIVRFSDSPGVPNIPDNDPHAAPRGMAIRFQLAEHSHTDIVSHSVDAFPARTGEEFLELLKALATSDTSTPSEIRKIPSRSRNSWELTRRRWRLFRCPNLPLQVSPALLFLRSLLISLLTAKE